jgi:protein-S-isoprenylcysteine O-methyltransferase Ste14
MSLARYIVGAFLVVWLPPAVVWWIIVHPFVAFWRRLGAKLALSVVAVMMVALALALVPLRDALLGRDLGTSWPLVGLAAGLMAVALIMAVRRRRYLTYRILSGVPELEGDARTLLTEGPYAVVRHPRYVEVALGTIAYACFANHVGAYVMAVLVVPVLHVVVLLEERELVRRFGAAYERYRAQVPRYLPRAR